MTVIYPVVFTQTRDEKDTYLIFVPDLNGMTEGYGLSDSIKMAKDYIGNALYLKNDSEISSGSDISEIDVSKSEFADCGKSFVSLVDVDIDVFRRTLKNKTVRRNITLPEWLDEMATAAKINVSAITQSALKAQLNIA